MTPEQSIIGKMYETLRNDEELRNLVTGIYTQSQKPKSARHPFLLIWVRDAVESSSVGVLRNVFVDCVARSNSPDGVDSELDRIYERADHLLNHQYFKMDGVASATVSSAGFPAMGGVFDEASKDYFKRWRYRMIVKTVS